MPTTPTISVSVPAGNFFHGIFTSRRMKGKAKIRVIINFLIFLPQFIIAQNITTVAGTGTAGYNGDGIPATTAQFNGVQGLALDGAGNIYAADIVGNRIRKITISTGLITTIAGTGTGGYNGDEINGPCRIIFDNAGNIYIAEYGGARVRKINIGTGNISTIAGTGSFGYNGDGILATAAQLSGCAYIKFDAAENMFIGEGSNQRVREIFKSTSIITTIAGTGTQGYNGDGIPATTAQLNYPFYVLFDQPKCSMYIADYYNNRIRKVTGGFIGCIVLPVKLLSFRAKNKGGYNFLEWQTVGGINTDYFEIERSNDSRNFEVIDIVNGAASSARTYSYFFIDQHPLNGMNYYRLRQADNDGTLTYSQIIAVTSQTPGNFSINIYPNPGNGQITVTSSGIIDEITISNAAGQIIYRNRSNEKNLFLQLGQTGVFFIQITTANQTTTKKITVCR